MDLKGVQFVPQHTVLPLYFHMLKLDFLAHFLGFFFFFFFCQAHCCGAFIHKIYLDFFNSFNII